MYIFATKQKKNMESICIIKDIYKTLYQFEKAFADVHEITINEAMLLCCLKDGETKSAGTICEYIGLSNSRVSKVITSVENKGYIRRNINKEDKRQMFFSLTSAGKEKVRQMMNAELRFDGLFGKLQRCMEKG
ncbi:MAG: hypothetical protein PARBA_03310 [Parabacteroides sp.]